MSLASDLSYNTRPLFEAVDAGYIPLEWTHLGQGITCYSRSDEAFSLNPPIAGITLAVSNHPGLFKPTGDGFVLRTILGYAAACRYLENQAAGNLGVANLINSMLIAVYKTYGTSIQNVTFKRPGTESADYFRELDNSAGLELRLYGEFKQASSNGAT
jgi:hypothetical protein